ncbi:MAG: hypothetical protein QNJ72_14970 [Pleurocapsa sp. MO_226.B13]|nr:hypothetical protein [Pleurocapsa sp. MO_226.B13]
MITAKQAVKACILAQFLTGAGLTITSFRYYQGKEIIFIECGYGGEIGLEIDNQGGVTLV